MSCPICGKPTLAAERPFCSRRCAEVDLGRWLGNGYRIGDEGEGRVTPVPPPEEGAEDGHNETP